MRYDEIRTLLKSHFTDLLNRHKEAIAKSGRLSETDRRMHETSIDLANDLDFFDQPHGRPEGPTDGIIEKYDLEISPRARKPTSCSGMSSDNPIRRIAGKSWIMTNH